VQFTRNALEDYAWWERHDKKMLARLHKLLDSIRENPRAGLGKPEPLQYHLSGLWSRRLSHEHRLVYKINPDGVVVWSCRFHYAR
jgi:toxin YoeB